MKIGFNKGKKYKRLTQEQKEMIFNYMKKK